MHHKLSVRRKKDDSITKDDNKNKLLIVKMNQNFPGICADGLSPGEGRDRA